MTLSPLARAAGPLAISAAVLVVLTRIVIFLTIPVHLQQLKAAVVEPTHAVNSVVSILAFALLIVAAFAAYERQARTAGTFGAVAVGAAVIGTVFMAGDWWYEAFAVPWMAEIAPAAFETGAAGRLLIGGLTSFVLFGLGWALFGIASLRAGVFPRAISATVLIGGILSAVPIGVAYRRRCHVRPRPALVRAGRRAGSEQLSRSWWGSRGPGSGSRLPRPARGRCPRPRRALRMRNSAARERPGSPARLVQTLT